MAFTYSMIVLSALDIVLRTIPELRENRDHEKLPFFIIEIITVAWFTFELLLKFLICPNKMRFLISPFTILDLLSIMPYYVYLCASSVESLKLIKNISRVFKIASLLKILQISDSLGAIMQTLRKSYREITVFLIYLNVCIVIFSTFVYYLEYKTPDTIFTSIPATFWYTVVTMTTVGNIFQLFFFKELIIL
jgi:potassium voltage-gated channel Shaker-related subfamily A protein 10